MSPRPSLRALAPVGRLRYLWDMATVLHKPPPAATLERIQTIVGPKGWTTEPTALAPHLLEERGHYRGRTAMLVRPASTEEVAAVVRVCAETRTPIVPHGGNTGMMGGATPFEHGGEILLNLSRLNRLRAVDPLNYTMTAEAGCVLASLQQAAEDADRLFPLSLGAEGTLVIITAAVLKLFPRPRETETAFMAVRDPKAAIELLARVRGGTGDAVTAFELISRTCLDMVLRHIPGTADPLAGRHDWYVLLDASSGDSGGGLREALERALADAMEAGLVLDATLAASAQQSKAMWRIRDSITEAQKSEGGSIKHDVSVPVSSAADFIAEASTAVAKAIPGIRPVTFGHVGDGNSHFTLSQPGDEPRSGTPLAAYLARWGEINRIVHDIVARMEGSISAEHGIGRRKLDELAHYKSPAEIALMRTLKRAIDPHNIMNPGKVVTP